MHCARVKLPDGTVAIVCTSGGRGYRERAHRCECGQKTARLQCDWKLGSGKTCDKWICAGCAQEVGPDKHLCHAHQRTYIEWQARHPHSTLDPQPSTLDRSAP